MSAIQIHIGSAVILAIILFALYSASAWIMLRSVTNRKLDPLAWASSIAAIAMHSYAIVHLMRGMQPVSIGLLEAASMLAWILAALACLIAIEHQNRALTAILLGIAAFGATATGSGRSFAAETAPGWEFTAHITLSLAAAGLLFAAAVTAVLLVVLDSRLRAHRVSNFPSMLPPIDTLEKIMFRSIGAGFALLTLSLFTGFVFVTNLFAQHLIHKTVLSLTAWVLFGVLLFGRMRYGWRGRFAVRLTLWGFGMLLLAYFGAKFVLEYLKGAHWG